jgi:hypothetical protein
MSGSDSRVQLPQNPTTPPKSIYFGTTVGCMTLDLFVNYFGHIYVHFSRRNKAGDAQLPRGKCHVITLFNHYTMYTHKVAVSIGHQYTENTFYSASKYSPPHSAKSWPSENEFCTFPGNLFLFPFLVFQIRRARIMRMLFPENIVLVSREHFNIPGEDFNISREDFNISGEHFQRKFWHFQRTFLENILTSPENILTFPENISGEPLAFSIKHFSLFPSMYKLLFQSLEHIRFQVPVDMELYSRHIIGGFQQRNSLGNVWNSQ